MSKREAENAHEMVIHWKAQLEGMRFLVERFEERMKWYAREIRGLEQRRDKMVRQFNSSSFIIEKCRREIAHWEKIHKTELHAKKIEKVRKLKLRLSVLETE